ncbi:MAG TPA: hypothetical protein VGF19_06780 [Candidatus Acidoferrum sp.]
MRKSPKEQHLETLESEFAALLVKCLRESAAGRWGLFDHNQHKEAARYLRWDEADHLKDAAREIRKIRAEWGLPNELVEKFLKYYAMRGANAPSEPKLAAKLLAELGVEK